MTTVEQKRRYRNEWRHEQKALGRWCYAHNAATPAGKPVSLGRCTTGDANGQHDCRFERTKLTCSTCDIEGCRSAATTTHCGAFTCDAHYAGPTGADLIRHLETTL